MKSGNQNRISLEGLHGNEMFIMGDIERIKNHFPDDQWCNLVLERWRYDYQPLERYVPFENLFDDWKVRNHQL